MKCKTSQWVRYTFKIPGIASFMSFSTFRYFFPLLFCSSHARKTVVLKLLNTFKTFAFWAKLSISESFKFLLRVCGNVLLTAADGLVHRLKKKKKSPGRPTLGRKEYSEVYKQYIKKSIWEMWSNHKYHRFINRRRDDSTTLNNDFHSQVLQHVTLWLFRGVCCCFYMLLV